MPTLINSLIDSVTPTSTGVRPVASHASVSAPFSSKRVAHRMLPLELALCNGVAFE